ncbi:hypothetical protein PVAP13_6KG154700 [Panicum virgatum]|uniref:glucose-1-phosphate adenylyltransferase n=1 Tax=Panicum virgatum TaxID=38727 RepID=A0A8T0RCN0_PANVG|nr:hypothetical protein PVAP13_6KG154700 [Panicum virgatum]
MAMAAMASPSSMTMIPARHHGAAPSLATSGDSSVRRLRAQPRHGRRGRGTSVSTVASRRRPFVFTPRAVSDSKSSQTCLDPDASTSVLGIILGGGAGTRLYPLTKKRAKPAVPLGPKGDQLKAMMVDTTILGLDDVRAKEMPYIASMGIYVFSKDVMLQLLREQFPGANDFGSEVIPGATSIGKRVQAYLYDGYWEDIGTIEAFYNANLGITKKPVPDFSFYDRSAPIYTQPRHLPPSKVLDADVTDSVIGEGCVIKNCKIHHSVVGLRSCISEGAIIEDTLLMGADYYETEADKKLLAEKGGIPIGIGKNSHIRRAIIDKNARIGDNVKIINVDNVQEAARETDGYFIKGGIVTVIKDALLPTGTVI